jgi:SH3 domain protein
MSLLRSLLLLLALCLTVDAHSATTAAYVAQGAKAELKSGLSKSDKVIRALEPGTPLTVVKKNAKLGYTKVQTANGEAGWLPSRLLTSEAPPPPPAEAPVAAVEIPAKSPQQLQAELEHLQTELQAVRQASANVLRIQAERDLLEENVISLRRELETALREKSVLNDDQKQVWFLIGGGVLFAGILIGVLLPRLSVRRQNSWSSF